MKCNRVTADRISICAYSALRDEFSPETPRSHGDTVGAYTHRTNPLNGDYTRVWIAGWGSKTSIPDKRYNKRHIPEYG